MDYDKVSRIAEQKAKEAEANAKTPGGSIASLIFTCMAVVFAEAAKDN